MIQSIIVFFDRTLAASRIVVIPMTLNFPALPSPARHRGIARLPVGGSDGDGADDVLRCRQGEAILAGKAFSPELAEEARRAAGAPAVRGVGPGMVLSADRRPNRLNVEVDKQHVVTGFRCE